MVSLLRASRIHNVHLVWAAALLIAVSLHHAAAQQATPPASSKSPAPTLQRRSAAETEHNPADPDRSSAYYHYGLAHLYEEMAVNAGRPEYANQAVEEYKLALYGERGVCKINMRIQPLRM